MLEAQGGGNLETLFSFELFVESVQLERKTRFPERLAVGVRLLDFPTLLIHQPQQAGVDRDGRGEYVFNRGKACFFLMKLDSLYTRLSHSPLCALVLDVTGETPGLVGSSLASLAEVVASIRRDVAERGPSAPSSHGGRRLVGVSSLTGENVGSVGLSYKLQSLGASLLPGVGDRKEPQHRPGLRGQRAEEVKPQKNTSAEALPSDRSDVQSPGKVKSDMSRNSQNKEPATRAGVCVPAKHRPKTQIPQTLQDTENYFEEDLTTFCPPHLYYTRSAEENSTNWGQDYKVLIQDSDAFTFEDSSSEDEMAENRADGPSSPVMERGERYDTSTLRNQKTSGMSSNVLGEALRQMPLLNALLVELSQLTGQNQPQPLSVHPNLAWIYRPASAEPSPRKTLEKNGPGTGHDFKHLHSPRNCSTPIIRPTSTQKKNRDEDVVESKSSSKSPRKKLVYGTTKTFNLRLKQISPLKVKGRECVALMQTEKQTTAAKGKTKSENKIAKFSKRGSVLNQGSSLNENIETMIQSVTVDSALHRTTTLKQKGHEKHSSLRISETPPLSERRDKKLIHIPTVDSDSVSQNRNEKKNHSESNRSQSESDRHRDEPESSGSSRQNTSKSSFSQSSRDGHEEADYADDFNSLGPSDAYSPDPMSSPEHHRAKTPKSPVRPYSCNSDRSSESAQRRTVLPVPIKAPSSPQHALRGTHIIRPRTHASALSLSSDDGERDRSTSFQTICSRKQKTEIVRVDRSPRAESFVSSTGQRSESTKDNGPVQGLSAESVSSFEPQEAEELEDELGSLDFRKEYQHISELVANKLLGYTM